jgi:DNA-binding NtrC family response regulator
MNQERTILHVDDDPRILRVVRKILEADGYKVISLDDPSQVTKRRLESGARVVLLDIDMPETDGLTVLRDIKCEDGGVQVIMLTGIASMNTILQSMRWGAEACVFKSITDRSFLLSRVNSAFEKIDCWWNTLDELNYRRRNLGGNTASATITQDCLSTICSDHS